MSFQGSFSPSKPASVTTQVDLVDLGGTLAFEGERDLVAVHARPIGEEAEDGTVSPSSMSRTPFGMTASTCLSSRRLRHVDPKGLVEAVKTAMFEPAIPIAFSGGIRTN